MLFIEDKQTYGKMLSITDFSSSELTAKYSEDDICYTLIVLNGTNYLDSDLSYMDHRLSSYSVRSITWEGHKFLDTIRDPKVWRKTKSIASKFESVSVTMLSSIASNVINHLIDKSFGY